MGKVIPFILLLVTKHGACMFFITEKQAQELRKVDHFPTSIQTSQHAQEGFSNARIYKH